MAPSVASASTSPLLVVPLTHPGAGLNPTRSRIRDRRPRDAPNARECWEHYHYACGIGQCASMVSEVHTYGRRRRCSSPMPATRPDDRDDDPAPDPAPCRPPPPSWPPPLPTAFSYHPASSSPSVSFSSTSVCLLDPPWGAPGRLTPPGLLVRVRGPGAPRLDVQSCEGTRLHVLIMSWSAFRLRLPVLRRLVSSGRTWPSLV